MLLLLAVSPSGATAEGSAADLALAGLLVGYVIVALVLFSQGTTPGKRILRVRVVREDGRPAGIGIMLLREVIGKFLSAMVFCLGYLWIILDSENQGWHDKLASSYVVKTEF